MPLKNIERMSPLSYIVLRVGVNCQLQESCFLISQSLFRKVPCCEEWGRAPARKRRATVINGFALLGFDRRAGSACPARS